MMYMYTQSRSLYIFNKGESKPFTSIYMHCLIITSCKPPFFIKTEEVTRGYYKPRLIQNKSS